MALFTDGQINSLRDLERYESGLLDVTSVEQIDVSAKMALAQDDIAADLLAFLLKQSARDPRNFIFSFQTASARRAIGVTDVVATEPLRRWHALKTIELTYEDAYHNQLNDRYKGKLDSYRERAKRAAGQLYEVGVGLVADPIVKAVAPVLVSVAVGGASMTYYVRITWVNRAGQEGAPSDVVALETVDGSKLVVTASNAPANAAGWNAYVGSTPDGVTLQNDTPNGATMDWAVPPEGLKLGRAIGHGQEPDRYLANDRVLLRG